MSTPPPIGSKEPREALFAHLRADSGVIAAVGTRVHQMRVPDGAAKPLLVIWPPISRVPGRDLGGVARRQTRLQITAMAATQTDAETAAKAVFSCVEGFAGLMAGVLPVILATVDAERQVDEPELGEVHHHLDVLIVYE